VLVGPASIVKSERITPFGTETSARPAILHGADLLDGTVPMVVEFWHNPVGIRIAARDPYRSRDGEFQRGDCKLDHDPGAVVAPVKRRCVRGLHLRREGKYP
jgi:hypothetical protein